MTTAQYMGTLESLDNSLTTAQYMGTLESLENHFMDTLAPLSRMCAFTYTVPPLAEVHMPHSPRTGSKGYPKSSKVAS